MLNIANSKNLKTVILSVSEALFKWRFLSGMSTHKLSPGIENQYSPLYVFSNLFIV